MTLFVNLFIQSFTKILIYLVPDLDPDLVPDLVPDLDPNLDLDLVPDLDPDLVPDLITYHQSILKLSSNFRHILFRSHIITPSNTFKSSHCLRWNTNGKISPGTASHHHKATLFIVVLISEVDLNKSAT